MRTSIYFIIVSGLLLMLSSSVSAHIGDSHSVLPHIFTGEHLLVTVLVGVCIAFYIKRHRQSGE